MSRAGRPSPEVESRGFAAMVQDMMDAAWREPGFCVPNQATYPHQWLWDSCFHAVIWCELGSDRAVTELASLLSMQATDGFVPHMIYWSEPDLHAEYWGRPGLSSITQPPMYGHAVAAIRRAGRSVPRELVQAAVRGLLHLGARPRTVGGLVPVFHPWETGCDDSPRWDDWLGDDGRPDPASRVDRWRIIKDEMVASLQVGPEGHAVGNDRFTVGSVGFNALVAWNARELESVLDPSDGVDGGPLDALAAELTEALRGRWQQDRWVDDGPPSGRLRTVDAMTALLVDPRPEGFEALLDPGAYGGPYGPSGVHRAEQTYDPRTYWRGSAWPQLSYLAMVAAEQAGRLDDAANLAARLAAGAERSGLAEFWEPDTGEGLGAIPQTWAGLGLVAANRSAGC